MLKWLKRKLIAHEQQRLYREAREWLNYHKANNDKLWHERGERLEYEYAYIKAQNAHLMKILGEERALNPQPVFILSGDKKEGAEAPPS